RLRRERRRGRVMSHTTTRDEYTEDHESDHTADDFRFVEPRVRFIGRRDEPEYDGKEDGGEPDQPGEGGGDTALAPQSQVRQEQIEIGDEKQDQRRLREYQVGVLHGRTDEARDD